MTAQQKILLDEIVWVDFGRMSGEPCFRGTRVPVQMLIDHIAGSPTLGDPIEPGPGYWEEKHRRLDERLKTSQRLHSEGKPQRP